MRFASFTSFVAFCALTSATFAAPGLRITAGPVGKGGNPNTGPGNDPLATQGQWFRDIGSGTLESRTHEFYDNIPNQGGGALGHLAIRGTAGNFVFTAGPGSPMTNFSIFATITNDLPGNVGFQPGANSHGEFLTAPQLYQGTMVDVKLTGEFAFPSAVQVPITTLAQIAAGVSPYTTPQYPSPSGSQGQAILSLNEDQEAWYSFTDTGSFIVPTWDYGNIAPGQSVTRELKFQFSGAFPGAAPLLDPSSSLYALLLESQNAQVDLLMNRTTDLKIGDWVDVLAADFGAAYPNPAFRSGNVSVFFNVPEPTMIVLPMLAGAFSLRRRK